MLKSVLLKNKYIKKFNDERKLKSFYRKGRKAGNKSISVLFWSTGGMIVQTNLEGIIATALKLRGHKANVILCDSVYKACAKRIDIPEVPISDWGKYCRSCISQNTKIIDRLGISYSYISELVTKEKADELRTAADKVNYNNYKDLSHDGLNLGNHLESAMFRHTKGGAFDQMEELLKEYAYTVLINAEAAKEAVKKFDPGKVYMSHGIYADWGPALSVFLKNAVEVVSYFCCYLTGHFYFGIVKNFNETFLTVSEKFWNKAKSSELAEIQKSRLQNFIERRYKENVTHDMKGLLKEYKGNSEYFYSKYGLDKSKPVWGIMTHINWDAVSDYFEMIHKNFDEWLNDTIKEIYNIKDVQWLIKIHPSELNDNPETGCQKFIEKNFPDLPSHIKVIKYDDDISTLDFYGLLDGAVTVMGTGGLELALQGKPVILAGDAHYSKKGFTYDSSDRESYSKLLADAKNITLLDEEMHSLAWKYGYIYFIQKQIPLLPVVHENLHIDFTRLNDLVPEQNKFIDFICDKIISGEDFILTENLVETAHITDKGHLRKADTQ